MPEARSPTGTLTPPTLSMSSLSVKQVSAFSLRLVKKWNVLVLSVYLQFDSSVISYQHEFF